MATYRTLSPGNTALESQVWTLTIEEAKDVLGIIDNRAGTYWETHLLKPYKRACRTKADTLTVETAHFTTGEFANALAICGVTVTEQLLEGETAVVSTPKQVRKARPQKPAFEAVSSAVLPPVHYGIQYVSPINATGLAVEIACHAALDQPYTDRKADVTCNVCLATFDEETSAAVFNLHVATADDTTVLPDMPEERQQPEVSETSEEASKPVIRFVTDLGVKPKPQSERSSSWTTCFVCQEGKARPEQNGRCKDCWEFFRSTGTDRTQAELTATKDIPIKEITSKGLLHDVSRPRKVTGEDPATPAQIAARAGVRKITQQARVVKSEQPGKLCGAGCGKTIYGKTVTICAPCWKAGKRQVVQSA